MLRKDQLANAVSTYPLLNHPRQWASDFEISELGDFRALALQGSGQQTLAWGRRKVPPPRPTGRPGRSGKQDSAHLVLSESIVWKRSSSSLSLRTPSAKKSWNSSKDSFPSSARKGGRRESSWCLSDRTSPNQTGPKLTDKVPSSNPCPLR